MESLLNAPLVQAADIDAHMATLSQHGVDIGEYVFDRNKNIVIWGDHNHMCVIGYIVQKYVNPGNDALKNYLNAMYKEHAMCFDDIVNMYFGMIVVRGGRRLGFRKCSWA